MVAINIIRQGTIPIYLTGVGVQVPLMLSFISMHTNLARTVTGRVTWTPIPNPLDTR